MENRKDPENSSRANTVTQVMHAQGGKIFITTSHEGTKLFPNKREAERWLRRNNVSIEPEFMQMIADENTTNQDSSRDNKKKEQRDDKEKRTKSAVLQSLNKTKPKEPDIGLSIATATGTKVVTIKVENQEFHDFDAAIEYVKKETSFQKERLDYLIPGREEWYRNIWVPRVKGIIGDYKEEQIPFTELFFRMNDRYKKAFSEEEALNILSLCKDTIICKEEIGEDGNRLAKNYYYSLMKVEPKKEPILEVPVLPQPQITDTKDDNSIFKEEFQRLKSSDYNQDRKDVFVGLDFGTSFTKVAYQYTPGDRGIILFGDSPFKPTVVYYDETEKKLSFFNLSSRSRQIQFFKATIVKDSERYSELRYNNIELPSPEIRDHFELLCSVFFISNTLLFVRHKLNELFPFDAILNVAMGIPIFGYNTNTIYNKALHAGIYIANKEPDPSVLPIERVYELYLESMLCFDDSLYTGFPFRFQHCTIPELFTESLYLLNKKTYAPGYYYIVDIGGGTSDFAFIHKDNSSSVGQFDYYCPSAVVAKLGNEVRKACMNSKQSADNYRDEFGLKYRTTIARGKFGLQLKGYMEITQLLFGGGAVDPSEYYQKHKSTFTSGLHSISCKVKSRTDNIEDNPFIPQELNLSSDDKQRLIIATQLANPETSSSFIKSWPEQYDHTPPIEPSPLGDYDVNDLYPSQYDDIN